MAVDYSKRMAAIDEKQAKLDAKQKRVTRERKQTTAKYDRAVRKAETEATFVLGTMLLRQFPDYRGINWQRLEKYLTRAETAEWFVQRFFNPDYDEGKPYENLNKFKENSNNVY